MDNVEQQCEDALFELCDARERYPSQCADELEKCIKLETDIHMMKVFQKSNIIDKLPLECIGNINVNINESKTCFKHLDEKLKDTTSRLENLKAVMDQIKRERICLTNKLLEG